MTSFIDSFNEVDESGNALSVCSESWVLSLKLSNEPKKRNIGRISEHEGDIFYVKSVKRSNVFRKNNSIGLHWSVIEKLPMKSFILINLEDQWLKVGKEEAMEKGSFLFFKKQGFEKQFFVELKDWRDCDSAKES